MPGSRTQRPRAVEYVLLHAWFATRVRTPEGAAACNAELSRMRDFLLHTPATEIALESTRLSTRDVVSARGPALDAIRQGCGACGLCARAGLEPP